MAETPVTRSTTSTRKTLLGLSVLLIVLGGGVAVWTTTCPCNQTPGFMLLGDVQTTPVTDWSFVTTSRSVRFRSVRSACRTQ